MVLDQQAKKDVTILKRVTDSDYHKQLRLLYVMCAAITVSGTQEISWGTY